MVKKFVYPTLYHPLSTNLFRDQYAFRPTGSTTAALISLQHQIADILQYYPYVHLIALDFTKAFDTVRHSTLLQKCASLPMDNTAHNWILKFLEQRNHCTNFNGETSPMLSINASIVQGSGIGPATYVLNASDLQPLHPDDRLNKYADDSYLIVPSSNSQLIPDELEHINHWALQNNLTLNVSKTKEMIVRRPRCRKKFDPPPVLKGISRVSNMNILGVVLQDNFSFNAQVDRMCSQGAQTLYAIRTLSYHGLSGPPLWEVTRATLLSRLTYASQAWWGLLDASGKAKMQALLGKAIKQGFLPQSQPSFTDICNAADQRLFSSILLNPNHVLHHYLTPVKQTSYNFRPRAHNRMVPRTKDSLFKKTFIIKMLCLDSY